MPRKARTSLTPLQRAYADFLVTPKALRGTQEAWIEEHGVSRVTLSKWRTLRIFIEYRDSVFLHTLGPEIEDIVREQIKLAISDPATREGQAAAKIATDYYMQMLKLRTGPETNTGPKYVINFGADRRSYEEVHDVEIIDDDGGGND